ncbi:hypothetical protein D3C75_731570 [compost metagenome]
MNQRLRVRIFGYDFLRHFGDFCRSLAVQCRCPHLSRSFIEQEPGILCTRHALWQLEIPKLHIVMKHIAVRRNIMRPAPGMCACPGPLEIELPPFIPEVIQHVSKRPFQVAVFLQLPGTGECLHPMPEPWKDAVFRHSLLPDIRQCILQALPAVCQQFLIVEQLAENQLRHRIFGLMMAKVNHRLAVEAASVDMSNRRMKSNPQPCIQPAPVLLTEPDHKAAHDLHWQLMRRSLTRQRIQAQRPVPV